MTAVRLDTRFFDAAILDMDGVVTQTASVHERAWKEVFDMYLGEAAERSGGAFAPFTHEDYLRYVDGKPRYDGVRSFLGSRGIELPDADHAGKPSVRSIGHEKNARFLELLDSDGAKAFPHVREFVAAWKAAGRKVAVISASRNAAQVLAAAGVADLFDVRVDGVVAEELGLAGKPDPAIFFEAARRLGAQPARTLIIEDAIAGVEAGHAGGFALVIGMDRAGSGAELLGGGADVTVPALDSLEVVPCPVQPMRPAAQTPRLPDVWESLVRGMPRRRKLAVFLDYDGTLTPIVERPEDAILAPAMRERLASLSERCFLGIVSGRDASFVVEQVGLDTVAYLGSHGFQVVPARDRQAPVEDLQRFDNVLPVLDAAQGALEAQLATMEGTQVERKRYAVAVHYRRAPESSVPGIRAIVEREVARRAGLRMTGGKKVFELRPDVDWDKGKAIRWALRVFGLGRPDVLPVYAGDDVTDEDAFRELAEDGLTVVVADGERPTSAIYRVSDPAEVGRLLERLPDVEAGMPRPWES